MSVVDVLVAPRDWSKAWMPYIAIGTGTTPVADGDAALEAEVYRKEGEVEAHRNSYIVKALFGEGEPREDALEIAEIGLFDSESGGTMAARWVLPDGITMPKDNIDELDIACILEFVWWKRLTSFEGRYGCREAQHAGSACLCSMRLCLLTCWG